MSGCTTAYKGKNYFPSQPRSAAAARASADIKNANVEILLLDTVDVFVAKVPVENSVVLVGSREYVLDAERSVAKADVLRRQRSALAPTTFDVNVCVHGEYALKLSPT